MKLRKTKFTCTGVGLVALDVIINGNPDVHPKLQAGGSCGNVLSILSYLKWSTYPIARLKNDNAGKYLISELNKWGVNVKYITTSTDGSTPIIIHRIFRTKKGVVKHKFEFKIPETSTWLPSYKPVLAKTISEESFRSNISKVFYFDKISRGTIELAKVHRKYGSLIVFEPSGVKNEKHFQECLQIAHVLKYSHERLSKLDKNFQTSKVPLQIETMGAAGLRFRTNNNNSRSWKQLDAFQLDDIKDTAGAGDWCTAGIIHSMGIKNKRTFLSFSSEEIESILNYGQVMATISCKFEGARGLMYSLQAVDLERIIKKLKSNLEVDITNNTRNYKRYRRISNFNEVLS